MNDKRNKSHTGLILFTILLVLLMGIGYFKITGTLL